MRREKLPRELAEALLHHAKDPTRVDAFYGPIAAWCLEELQTSTGTFIIGVSGPQGSGKTTLTTCLSNALSDFGVRATTISIDDFYLTHSEQSALAKQHPGDRLLEHRGAPGTHDVKLATTIIRSLKSGAPTIVPTYDKSAYAGRGDRADESRWRQIDEPLRLLFLEGWMLGFEALPDASCPASLREMNAFLPSYSSLFECIDAFVLIESEHIEDIVQFRVDAERARRAHGEPALSDDDARDYIERFLPVYRAYVPGLRARQPGHATLRAVIGSQREPLSLGVLK